MEVKFVEVKVPAVELLVESRGVGVKIDLAKVPSDLMAQVVVYGLRQKIADAASGAARDAWKSEKGDKVEVSTSVLREWADAGGKATVEKFTVAGMQKAVDALLAGKWEVRAKGGTASRWNDVQKEALSLAKDAMTALFKAAARAKGLKPVMASFESFGDKATKYIDFSGKAPTWKDDAVMEWLLAQDAAGKATYMESAREIVAAKENATADAEGDVEDMLADF